MEAFDTNPHSKFIEKIISGPGGFLEWEDREWVIFHGINGREKGIAAFLVRCLANPNSKGSGEVLAAIIGHRAEQMK